MKVKMLKTLRGAADGFTVVTFEAGKTYDLFSADGRAEDLAKALVRDGAAVEVTDAVAAAEAKAAADEAAAAEGKKKAESEAKKAAAEAKKVAEAQKVLEAAKSKKVDSKPAESPAIVVPDAPKKASKDSK